MDQVLHWTYKSPITLFSEKPEIQGSPIQDYFRITKISENYNSLETRSKVLLNEHENRFRDFFPEIAKTGGD